jgi:glycosyltransferase involved in cell wall biosynthesis
LFEKKVSVIIPTYNRCEYVTRAIDSVLAQTYKNYEIIVVDDGSTDDTAKVLEKRYKGKISYIYQKNQGPSAARNKGLRAALYDLVAFLDSDDFWLPRKLEYQIPLIMQEGVVLSYCNSKDELFPDGNDCFSDIGLNLPQESMIIDTPLEMIIEKICIGILTPTCICRKDAVFRAGGFDERLRVGEDTLLWVRMAQEGAFSNSSKVLVLRGQTNQNDQLTNRDDFEYKKKANLSRLLIFQELYLRSLSAPAHIQKSLRKILSNNIVEQSHYLAIDGDFKNARRKAFESLLYLPRGRTLMKAILGIIYPHLFCKIKRWRPH